MNGKKILVVDDDYYFRLLLEKSLTREGHYVTQAENGKQAQHAIGLGEFDLVISDIRMPEMDGIDLLRWVKGNHPLPFVLMTGFSSILETHQAADLGADGFLSKPFLRPDLVATVNSCFPEKGASTHKEELDSKYCKVSIDDFVSGKEMRFDIYIRLSETKYVKIAHHGENLPVDRIQAYKDKDILFLYMLKEDFRRYLDFNLTLAKAVTQSSQIDHQRKINFIKHTSEVLLQSFYGSEIDRKDFMQASALVENAISLISDHPDAANLLTTLSGHTDFLYAHSVGVSLYSTLIGKAMGWESSATIFKLSLGGLLHDIGKKEMPRQMLEKQRIDLSAEEVSLLETHPTRGTEILAHLGCIPADVLQIIHEHHENCLGFGYPLHLRKPKIHPLARVVAVANAFCNLAIKNPDCAGFPPSEAIRMMLSLNPEYYDEEAVKGLIRVFKIPGLEEEYFGGTKPSKTA